MLNRKPRYEVLSLKISKHKVVFRKYPQSEDKSSKLFIIDVWQKQKAEKGPAAYSLQLLHKEFLDEEEFPYEFSSEGLWQCLEDVLSKKQDKE